MNDKHIKTGDSITNFSIKKYSGKLYDVCTGFYKCPDIQAATLKDLDELADKLKKFVKENTPKPVKYRSVFHDKETGGVWKSLCLCSTEEEAWSWSDKSPCEIIAVLKEEQSIAVVPEQYVNLYMDEYGIGEYVIYPSKEIAEKAVVRMYGVCPFKGTYKLQEV